MNIPKFLGDLSRADAAVLVEYASHAKRIFEFGAGGSTMIMAQTPFGNHGHGELVCLETDQEWIDRTEARLRRLPIARTVRFCSDHSWREPPPSPPYDLVFIDGVDRLRLSVAVIAWPLLQVGGSMLFHDTQRHDDMENLLKVVGGRPLEMARVDFFIADDRGQPSNISAVVKRERLPDVDWHIAEPRNHWQLGRGGEPESFWTD